ncbi:MAG TPA: DsbA family protein [Candidatus Limnocylindria bacterium]|nr:DsbA family protein [Candidatus Limnocylindria bacterium]
MTRPRTRAQRQRVRRGGAPGTDERRPSGRQLAIAGAVAVAAVAALIAISGGTSAPAASTAPPNVRQAGHVRGVDTAPITIEEWADFQCPACGQFARTTEPQLLSTYVANGQVRLVYRHLAFLGTESQWAAEATECADEHGKFWEFHDRLYAAQAGENRGTFSKENLKRMGDELGLGPSFAACVDSGRYAQRVRDETSVGQGKGVRATPTLFVGDRRIEGAASYDQLKAVIDQLLAGR